MDQVLIRNYEQSDKEAVLNLLRLNTPKYFAPEEEKELVHYLDRELEHYFVVEAEGNLAGCGGINFSGNAAIAKISWDLFHPMHQGRGLGTMLLKHRIKFIENDDGLQRILVRTSQLAYGFYEKNGFRLIETVKDYWAPGFDLYYMEYVK